MRAVLLAAGLGDRLQHHTASVPKPLVPLDGRPLVAYTIDALAESGVSELVVVTGYRGPELRAALDILSPLPITYRHNGRFHLGASCSLAAAREACADDPFLLVMSDHLVDPRILRTLIDYGPRDGATIAADTDPRDAAYVDEATRILIDHANDDRVIEIGKGLPRWNALDTGVFHCSAAVWDALETAPDGCNLSEVFTVLAGDGRFYAADVTGAFWYDVDTPEDHAIAESLLRDRDPSPAAPA